MKQIFSAIWELLFPRLCPLCDAHVPEDRPLCRQCMEHLPRTEHAVMRENQTEMLFMKNRRFQRGASFLVFEKNESVQGLIHELKYHRRPELAYYLGREAAYEYMAADFFDEIDLIIPVPLHPTRLRKRGYNQAEELAKGISDVTGIPWDNLQHIRRIRATPYQAQLSQDMREANVKDAFRVNHPEELYRKHILLVDDVVTTGATLRAVMEALIPVRNCKISVFTLGKAV